MILEVSFELHTPVVADIDPHRFIVGIILSLNTFLLLRIQIYRAADDFLREYNTKAIPFDPRGVRSRLC